MKLTIIASNTNTKLFLYLIEIFLHISFYLLKLLQIYWCTKLDVNWFRSIIKVILYNKSGKRERHTLLKLVFFFAVKNKHLKWLLSVENLRIEDSIKQCKKQMGYFFHLLFISCKTSANVPLQIVLSLRVNLTKLTL